MDSLFFFVCFFSGLSSGPVYGLSCSGIEDNVGDCSLRTLDPSGCSQGAYITCKFFR